MADVVMGASAPLLVHWGEDHRIIYNDACVGLLANRHPWALGRPGAQVWGEIWDTIGVAIAAAKAEGTTGVSDDLHFAVAHEGGIEERVVRFDSSPIREADGTIGGVFTIVRELTGPVTDEAPGPPVVPDLALLRASEERFRRCFFEGPLGMAMTSPNKRPIEVNLELCSLVGYSREDLRATSWTEITHPDDVEAELREFERVLAGEIDGYSLRKRWIRKDGGHVHTIVSTQCVRRSDHSVDYFISIVQDVTQVVRAEEATQRAQAELAHTAQLTALGELAADIAHKLNQPLGTLVNNAHVCHRLLEKGGSPAAIRDAVVDIVAAANRASSIMSQIGALTRRGSAVRSMVPVRDVVVEVLALAQRRVNDARVDVDVDVPPEEMRVAADRAQLQQLLLNLILNAVEAMDHPSITRRVLAIRARPVDIGKTTVVEIAVSDSGRGFATDEGERLFQTFYTTKSHGMGMGLRISRSIAEAHGGHIWANCTSGGGTTFYCTLPLAS
jgi:PAS domain S-box-containing protein